MKVERFLNIENCEDNIDNAFVYDQDLFSGKILRIFTALENKTSLEEFVNDELSSYSNSAYISGRDISETMSIYQMDIRFKEEIVAAEFKTKFEKKINIPKIFIQQFSCISEFTLSKFEELESKKNNLKKLFCS